MMFAATHRTVLKAVAFIRPCVLPVPRPDAPEKCILRCTRRGKDSFEIASWTGVKTSGDLKFSTHFSASFADMESGSIAPTHISGRRDFVLKSQRGEYGDYPRGLLLKKCSQSVARTHSAVTSTGGLCFSSKLPVSLSKAVLHARTLVARGARWAHRAILRSTSTIKLAWGSTPCALELQKSLALVNAAGSNVD